MSASSQNAPPLERLARYGRARDKGLAIAQGMRAFKHGKLGWSDGKDAEESKHAGDGGGAIEGDGKRATQSWREPNPTSPNPNKPNPNKPNPSERDRSERDQRASTTDGADAGMDGADLPDRALRPAALALRGRTGAFVNACVQRARAGARRAERPLRVADIKDAARNGRDRPPTPSLVRRTAVHEAGHAIVALATGAGTVEHLSLDTDGGTTRISGVAIGQTAADYEDELTVLFGGRAAELVVLGDTSGGVGIGPDSDLARATRLATLMRTSFGLGDSLVYVGTLDDDFALRQAIGPVRAEVERMLTAAQKRALAIVREHRAATEAVAERLQRDGFVGGADAKAIWDERKGNGEWARTERKAIGPNRRAFRSSRRERQRS